MDVQVPLQLIPDGLAEQLHAVIGSLCVLLTARTSRCSIPQGTPRLLLPPWAVWRAGTATPSCVLSTDVQTPSAA